jgi:anti-sigma factor ChrR (cupin superfamily)
VTLTNQHTEELGAQASLYALGTLAQDEARAFEAHLAAGCAVCREELQEFEATVGLLSLNASPAAPRPQVRAQLLASLSRETETEAGRAPQQTLTIRAAEGEWREAFPGVLIKQLFADAERHTVTTLIRMRPGAVIPRHRHHGAEECIVLAGDVQTGTEALGAGDYHCAMAESVHERIQTVNGALFLIVGPETHEILEQL